MGWAHRVGPALIIMAVCDTSQRCGIRLIERIGEKSLASCNKVLDLGCGNGYLTSVIAMKVVEGTVLGVDPDKDRIELAQTNYSNIKNLKFIEGTHETFPADEYDLVFSNLVLHWIESKDVLFQRVYKYLKNGGQFFFSVPYAMPELLLQLSHLTGITPRSFFFSTSDEYKQLAADSGFTVSCFENNVAQYQWNNIDDVITWWTHVCPHICHGSFDPSAIDPVTLENFKKPYGKEPVGADAPVVYFTLMKHKH